MIREVELEDDSGTASVSSVLTLQSRTAEAVRRFDAHDLARFLPASLRSHIDEFKALLAMIQTDFIQLDVVEISLMQTEAAFRTDIEVSLAAADGRDFATVLPLFKNSGFDNAESELIFDPDVARFWLRGYQWATPVPWTD